METAKKVSFGLGVFFGIIYLWFMYSNAFWGWGATEYSDLVAHILGIPCLILSWIFILFFFIKSKNPITQTDQVLRGFSQLFLIAIPILLLNLISKFFN